MFYVKDFSYYILIKMLLGKTVNFKSDCDFFPNFNITGKIISYTIKNNELIFKLRIPTKNKIIDVGSNMKNLQFKII